MTNDYIRKQDAVEALVELRVNSLDAEKGLLILSGIAAASDIIESLEPADVVQVRHARWERYSGITIRCSWCKHVIHDWRLSECKYCPNCGTKMDGEE